MGGDAQKATLDQFLRRAVLLGGVYVVVSAVYELAYFSRLSLPVDLEGGVLWLIPRRLDPYVAMYSILLWGALVNLPPRYWDYVAQLVSIDTWLSSFGVAIQRLWALAGLAVGFALIKAVVSQQPIVEWDATRPLSWALSLVVPPILIFQSTWSLALLILSSAVGVVIYVQFRVFNRKAPHLRARRWPQWFMLRSLHLCLPFFLAVLFALVVLAVPSRLGRFRAEQDLLGVRAGHSAALVDIALRMPLDPSVAKLVCKN